MIAARNQGKRLRVSVSMLDAAATYDGTETSAQRIRRQLLRESFTPTPEMEFGSAFEEVVENPEPYEYRPFKTCQGYQNGMYAFTHGDIGHARRLLREWGGHVWQVPRTYPVEVSEVPVNLTMRADVLYTDLLVDLKTTGLEREMWTAKSQYRHQHLAYMRAFGVPRFRYLVYRFKARGYKIHLTGERFCVDYQSPGDEVLDELLAAAIHRTVQLAYSIGVLNLMVWE